MKKPIKVLMLPTEDKQHAIIKKNTSILLKQTINLEYSGAKQHLYITVSQDVEPVKDGDWCINNNGDTLYRIQTVYSEDRKDWRKIIATTDPKLTSIVKQLELNGHSKPSELVPQVQQSFLEEFVANPDGEYEVEYLTGHSEDRLKLNQDNEVSITSIEGKMYSLSDLERLGDYAYMNAKSTWDWKKFIKENL